MRRTKLAVLVLIIALAVAVFGAVPALAATTTPAAAQPGLHTAHCATMGTAGHMKVPYSCPMTTAECMGSSV